MAQPTCQILPPAMPGYRPYCPYTINPSRSGGWTAPDLARAEQLVRASGTRGAKVTVTGAFGMRIPVQTTGRYLVSVLDQLGYRASLQVITGGTHTTGGSTTPASACKSAGSPGTRTTRHRQTSSARSSHATPSSPTTPGNLNAAEFCNQRIDAQAKQALALQPSAPNAAGVTLGAHRPGDRRPGTLGAGLQPALSGGALAPGRQLPVRPILVRAHRPAVGPLRPLGRHACRPGCGPGATTAAICRRLRIQAVSPWGGGCEIRTRKGCLVHALAACALVFRVVRDGRDQAQ